MSTRDGGHRGAAVAALADREYHTAGDEYARAAWRVLAEPRDGQSPFEADEKGWVGTGVQHMVTSALAYRVAGLDARATRRGVEAVAVARDLRTALDHPAQRACLAELIADCRVAGGLDGATEAYDEAESAYREAGGAVDDPQYWGTTPLFEAAAVPVKQAARSQANGEIAVKWEDLHGADPAEPGPFLAHRATYKRQRFPALVREVIDDGYLAAPRGTTEYNNDNHRCPACGSTDVNWTADSVLCMRCSTPSERV